MFCIDTQYTERYIDKHLYRYCVNHGGITANASSSKKGLDSYWICEEMLDWCRNVFCQIFVGRFGVSFSPFERLFLGRFGFGQSCGLSVIA